MNETFERPSWHSLCPELHRNDSPTVDHQSPVNIYTNILKNIHVDKQTDIHTNILKNIHVDKQAVHPSRAAHTHSVRLDLFDLLRLPDKGVVR